MGWRLFWEYLDRVSVVIGVVTFFPIIWAVCLYISRNVRLRKSILAAVARAETHQPIYIELTGKNSLIVEAEKYLNRQNLTGEVLKNIELCRSGIKMKDTACIEKIKSEIIDIKLKTLARAPECIHLFYSGPVAIGIIIGDIFSNCKNVYIYHKDESGYALVTKI